MHEVRRSRRISVIVTQRRSLEVKFSAAPLFRGDIAEGFGEVPTVAVKVLRVVLALAVGMFRGFSQDCGAILPCAFAVAVRVFDADLHDVAAVGRDVAFGDGEATFAGLHLNAVIGDAETNGEAKSFREPLGCGGGVGVDQHGNDSTGWD